MAMYDYIDALRLGKKRYQNCVSKGEYPYLPVLDDILANEDIVSEVNLGIVDVPLDRIVGTRTRGRTQAFARNFMPLMPESSEFAEKWSAVYEYQIEQGIADPIKIYEFMNKYYVQEGNKRVSVLKYLHAYSVSAKVIRLLPKRSNDRDIRLYYEFLDFYQVSANSTIWFSREGSYNSLLEAMGKKPGEVWSIEEQKLFEAVINLFEKVFHECQTADLKLNASDAFLEYVVILGYDHVKTQTESGMRKDLTRIWPELELSAHGSKIKLVEQPEEENKEPGAVKLFNWLLPGAVPSPEMFKLGFIYPKTRETSSWAYSHDLGRIYLEQKYPGMRTCVYENAGTQNLTELAIKKALDDKCNIIFTIGPQMALPSVKAAVQHPEIKFFNCSVNISYSSIDTYFARNYESKFLMGALAAAISGEDKLGYIADYPIYGMLANVNAFAIGAGMINPRVKVHLKWSGLKEHHAAQELEEEGITYISGDDMITPANPSREYGLYHKKADGNIENIATSITDWGKFYDQLVQHACHSAGKWSELNTNAAMHTLTPGLPFYGTVKERKAINYWWGMSADVVDLLCAENLPIGTNRLIRFLRHGIKNGTFHPFYGEVYTRSGKVLGASDHALSAQEIIRAGWLCNNVIGDIPPIESFSDDVQPIIRLQGIRPAEAVTNEKVQGEKHEDTGSGR